MSNGSKDTGGNSPGELRVGRLAPEVRDLSGEEKDFIDWGLKIFSIPDKWEKKWKDSKKGRDIRIAVLDTGIAPNHSDLSGAVEVYKDFTDSPFDAADLHGHGTHVAGIIAARENKTGVVGVAPEARLLIGKVIGDDGSGTQEQLAEGIWWAIGKKVDIISISLENNGVLGNDKKAKRAEEEKIQLVHEAIKLAVNRGIFVICAAGNKKNEKINNQWKETVSLDRLKFPAHHPETIAVGAIDKNLNIPYFSAGEGHVDIVAPGEDILSTYPPNHFATSSGTSMAAPFVSGVAALMLAEDPDKYKNEKEPAKRKQMLRNDLLNELAIKPDKLKQGACTKFCFYKPDDLSKDIQKQDSEQKREREESPFARFLKLIVNALKGFFHGKGSNLKIALGALLIVLIVYVLIQYVL